jgi:phenol 2-monooxygenase
VQFHLNGFEPGDPEISDPAQRYAASGSSGTVPEEVDVLIVGCGPAGLTLAAQLSAFPDIRTCVVEQKPGPLLRGQADGIACRTMEMFEAYGFSERVLKEACWINETTFWKPDDRLRENIVRSGRVQDVEDGLSEFPHVVLNQARVHDFYLDVMRKSPARLEPYYARRLLDLEIDEASSGDNAYPYQVTARLERLDPAHDGQIETIKARYVVGCDGARSAVRKSIGRTLHGDSANHAWGVMDVLAVTDFPDVRFKSLIQSAKDGSIIIIPREGGYLFRLYIELDKLDAGERVSNRNITSDHLIAAARRILKPHTLEVKEVAWWSVYEIGQRLCDKFDDVPEADTARLPRVFIAGDACHTHSPKAGQGMNVSMQDGFNLGWKLASVLRKRCAPHLLHTYSAERQAVAKELIDFDRAWADVLSSASKSTAGGDGKGFDPAETQRYFVRHGRYTAGTATRYRPSILTGESPVRKYTPAGEDIDSVIDVRAVFQQGHRDLAVDSMPSFLLPRKGRYGLRDYEKMFCADLKNGHDIFTMRGIDRRQGCMVVVRPDQYIAHVLPLDGYAPLAAFFDGFMMQETERTTTVAAVGREASPSRVA